MKQCRSKHRGEVWGGFPSPAFKVWLSLNSSDPSSCSLSFLFYFGPLLSSALFPVPIPPHGAYSLSVWMWQHLVWCLTHGNCLINVTLLPFPCSGFHIRRAHVLHPPSNQILTFFSKPNARFHFHEALQSSPSILVSPFPESLST